MTRTSRYGRMVLIVSAGLLMVGCSGQDIPSVGDLSDQVADEVEARGIERPDSVGCGGQISLSAGAQADCDLRYQDRGDLVAEVSVHRVGSDGLGFDMDIVDEHGNPVETD